MKKRTLAVAALDSSSEQSPADDSAAVASAAKRPRAAGAAAVATATAAWLSSGATIPEQAFVFEVKRAYERTHRAAVREFRELRGILRNSGTVSRSIKLAILDFVLFPVEVDAGAPLRAVAGRFVSDSDRTICVVFRSQQWRVSPLWSSLYDSQRDIMRFIASQIRVLRVDVFGLDDGVTALLRGCFSDRNALHLRTVHMDELRSPTDPLLQCPVLLSRTVECCMRSLEGSDAAGAARIARSMPQLRALTWPESIDLPRTLLDEATSRVDSVDFTILGSNFDSLNALVRVGKVLDIGISTTEVEGRPWDHAAQPQLDLSHLRSFRCNHIGYSTVRLDRVDRFKNVEVLALHFPEQGPLCSFAGLSSLGKLRQLDLSIGKLSRPPSVPADLVTELPNCPCLTVCSITLEEFFVNLKFRTVGREWITRVVTPLVQRGRLLSLEAWYVTNMDILSWSDTTSGSRLQRLTAHMIEPLLEDALQAALVSEQLCSLHAEPPEMDYKAANTIKPYVCDIREHVFEHWTIYTLDGELILDKSTPGPAESKGDEEEEEEDEEEEMDYLLDEHYDGEEFDALVSSDDEGFYNEYF